MSFLLRDAGRDPAAARKGKTADRWTRLTADYAAGATLDELADTYQLGRHYIRGRLIRDGVWEDRPRPVTARNQAVIDAYLAGTPMDDICAADGRQITSIYDMLRTHNVPLRAPTSSHRYPNRAARAAAAARMAAEHDTGDTLETIAARHGVSTNTARKLIRQHRAAAAPDSEI